MSDELERFPAFEAASAESNVPQETDELFGGRPFRLRLITFVTLGLLIIWPLSNLLFTTDPAEMIEMLAANPIIFYVTTIVFLWMIFALVYLAVWRENQSLLEIGLTRFKSIHIFWSLSFFMASALVLVGLESLLTSMGYPTLGELELLLPDTNVERIWWVALSFTAGFCEEIAFRGYLMTRLWRMTPKSWPRPTRHVIIVAISSVVFGVGHTYQGLAGFVLITAYGIMIALLFLRTRSLWPCIWAHFLLDFYNIFVPFMENNNP
ncbi:MAG: CPBP family intramembrane metalloprotease [candidate division Zixibacteria bacterium]|nr:CPBP family intramembrane metalloprotease [candidate division Zixibacteria bacterium]